MLTHAIFCGPWLDVRIRPGTTIYRFRSTKDQLPIKKFTPQLIIIT